MGKIEYVIAGTEGRYPSWNVDNILISTLNAQNTSKVKRISQEMKTKRLFIDSGGYQLVLAEEKNNKKMKNPDNKNLSLVDITFDNNTKAIHKKDRLNIAPIHVVQTAKKLYAEVMIGLDFPLLNVKGHHQQKYEFRKKFGFNLIWAHEVAELRKLLYPEVTYLVPLQCFNLKQAELFDSKINGIDFDGYSVIGRNMNAMKLMFFLIWLYRKGHRKVHVLGTASYSKIALMAYMARHYYNVISFDSTNWNIDSQYHYYMDHNNMKKIVFGDNFNQPLSTPIVCPCPWCQALATYSSIQNMDSTERTYILGHHNNWVIKTQTDVFYNNAEFEKNYIQYILSNARMNDCKTLCKVIPQIFKLTRCSNSFFTDQARKIGLYN